MLLEIENPKQEVMTREQSTLKFKDLLEYIRTGKMRLPHFQRKFEWEMTSSVELLDSIFKDVPIGNFNIWQTSRKIESERFVADNIVLGDLPEYYYILDGQQRSTTLFATLQGLTIQGKDYSRLYVDLNLNPNVYHLEKIVYFIGNKTVPENLFPIYQLWSKDFVKYTKRLESDRHMNNVAIYKEKLNEASIMIEKLSTESNSVAASIFHAINLGGKRLKIPDIMACFLFDEENNWYFHNKTEEFQFETKVRGFEWRKDEQLQLISILLNKGMDSKDIYNIKIEEVISNWSRIKSSVFLAIDFLKTNYNIQTKKQLFTNNLLYLISYFFYENGRNPSAFQRRQIEKFILYVGITNRYESTSKPRVIEDLKSIDNIVCSEVINQSFRFSILEIEEEQQEMIRSGSFKSLKNLKRFPSFIYSILAMKNPRSFSTGLRVLNDGTEQRNQMHKHHIFPKSTYGVSANNIFNIMLLDAETNQRIGNRKPSDYIKDYEENQDFRTIMESHFIGLDELKDIERDDMDSFIRHRMLKIIEFIKTYF